MTCLSSEQQCDFIQNVQSLLNDYGFEMHPFKLGWYNAHVQKVFCLPYPDDTLGFLVISTPKMFEKGFKPFVMRQECTGIRDPIDECVTHYFNKVKQAYPEHSIEAIHDYEMLHNRRPKILVQTVGHVSGAAYYYQKSDVVDPPWPDKQKICGVCFHPVYGGWFGLRGVLIFRDVLCPHLPRKEPEDIVSDQNKRIELLDKFNFHWQDWTFRDVIPVDHRYSEEQICYFSTKPSERKQLLENMKWETTSS